MGDLVLGAVSVEVDAGGVGKTGGVIGGGHQLVLRIVGLRRRLAADAGEGGGDAAGRVGRLEVEVHLTGHRIDAGVERVHHREVDASRPARTEWNSPRVDRST